MPWRVDAPRWRATFGFRARPAAQRSRSDGLRRSRSCGKCEVHVLQEGEALRGGNIALIAAGTGLGEALLHTSMAASFRRRRKAGHADFAARTEREISLLRRPHRALRPRRRRARRLRPRPVNIHRATHATACAAGVDLDDPGAPAAISTAALEHRCPGCVETLDMFVEAYGAEVRQPRAAERVDRRPVHRRRHRAEDPAGAQRPASSCARSSPSRRSKRCCNDAGESDPESRGGTSRRSGLCCRSVNGISVHLRDSNVSE